MAVINTYSQQEFLYRRQPIGDEPTGIDEPPFQFLNPPFDRVDPLIYPYNSSITVNLPTPVSPVAVSSALQPGFLQDYYFRVHIVPNVLDLGNLLSAQSRDVEVWNAYFVNNLLSSIDRFNDDGVNMTEPVAPPTVFAALESRIYSFQISTDGSPTLDALFIFNFATESPQLSIIGRRVVIWPFIPEQEFEESLEWKTDVLASFNNEQRIALRTSPRQTLSYDYLLDPQQFSRAKSINNQWAYRIYGVPIWAECTRKTSLSAGATSIALDTTTGDYRADDLILIWASDTQYEAVETLTITSSLINLKLPLSQNWGICYVCPLRLGRTLNGMSYKRSFNEYIQSQADFSIYLNKDLGNELSYPTYRNAPVLTDRYAVIGDISERILRTTDIFDNESGPIDVDITSNWVRFSQNISFIKNNMTDIWSLRRWVHARRGRQKSFWLPSWNKDLMMLVNVISTGSVLTVSPIGYPLYYTTKDIMIQLKTGTRIFRRVASALTDVDGNEVLTLTTSFGQNINVTDVDFICFISHVRFDSDKITFRHLEGGVVNVSVPILEVPE